MKKEYILEGFWSGYRGEPKLCHVEKTKHPELFENLKPILFTDNTYLNLRIRPKNYREKVKECLIYYSLIRECLKKNIFKVSELNQGE